MMVFSGGKSTKAPALFDIRIKSADHDVIVVKGAPHEAASVLLSGTIVLSVSEPMQIKKLNLRLYGMLRLNVTTTYRGPKGPAQRSLKYDKRFFEHVWDNINIQDYFKNLYDNYGSQRSIISKTSSMTNIPRLHHKAKSTTSLMSLGATTPSGSSHILVQGNYEFPFSAILPGSVTESVEGLPNASVIYKLQATIERSKFATDLICKKHLRVVRTLTPDSIELSETMSVDNTWPNKVDYSISVPGKAIAIGSATTIHILIVPLLKGLKLGPIKISLVEYSSYCAPYGAANSQERIVNKIKLSDPLNHLKKESDDLDRDFAFQDKWEVDTLFTVPPSLSKCTQDCNILSNIKVRHKLKFVISLINPDGHISELRASLPVQLFISPFVALGVRATDSLDSSASVSGHETDMEDGDNEMIFANTMSEIDLTAVSAQSASGTPVPSASSNFLAPPNYGNHIYDRLWSEIALDDTPVNSGRQSPVESGQESVMNSQQNLNALQQGLQRLHVERETEAPNEVGLQESYSSEGTTGGGNDQGISFQPRVIPRASTSLSLSAAAQSDYFAMPVPHHVQSLLSIPAGLNSPAPMLSPGIDHISRSNSFYGPQMSSPAKGDWKLNTLSRVPSYENAMKSDPFPVDLPPAYPDEEIGDRTYELEKPKLAHQKSLTLQKTNSGTQLSHAALSRNSSSTSLPKMQLSRTNTGGSNVSVNSVSGTNVKSGTASKFFGFGMTPLGNKDSEYSGSQTRLDHVTSPPLPLQRSSSRGTLSASSRSGSLVNLKNFLHKKEKK
ncbi:LAFE_0F10528g1_1 [Lachancea fermentati]|uniref:LAFE_0F10528g1_1 n=1 Tax=Lachancea fermentati TaxID=4955 RepID=A0A1G4MFB4_LACFM|nr:LAFE_0F10528g1_1 [Lachancea fermentati]